ESELIASLDAIDGLADERRRLAPNRDQRVARKERLQFLGLGETDDLDRALFGVALCFGCGAGCEPADEADAIDRLGEPTFSHSERDGHADQCNASAEQRRQWLGE